MNFCACAKANDTKLATTRSNGAGEFFAFLAKKELSAVCDECGASVGMSMRRLEKAGLVKISADTNDLRAKNIELTEKGEKLAAAARESGEKLAAIKYEGLSSRQIQSYSGTLQKIRENVQKYYEELEGQQL